ncbi:N-acetylmuramic acid 6-phosphate etherase [Kaistia dalseonensis]|uniref:N-acetylmuramic acid 6-phosphate etherase n=1 Tax=Kaistia dalseonensis TaxID=410840 RepID=A0ABU0HBY9_9HYPH|nr:N-acetylmuramic acid 6-phosphate etherase [Kaistia dalseonensis]MCX5497186.1 N-acetylmuramic acid 6-phosphate etherase [Kaistia dalseonensis]MDQ0439817.1 N-acetylmuramic acid 6-phosphate etherase [Kaistia dalseonensis]
MASPRTETVEDRYKGIDLWPAADILAALADGQVRGASAVRDAIPALALAAGQAAEAIRAGGRLVYVGAGSSGLIALIDALELPQTFGIPQEQIIVLLAGGAAMTTTLTGGPEDDPVLAAEDIARAAVTPGDFVVGVSASGSTPYTVTALRLARAAGAGTAAIACNSSTPLHAEADIAIVLDSGPEVLAGSTRMGAGTAQKAAFNMLSTMIAISLGHVVDGMMVNVRADNRKLVGRATGIVARIASVDEATAYQALEMAHGAVKAAILLAAGAPDSATAEALLERTGGDIRLALEGLRPT